MMLFLKLAYGDREKGNLFKECLRSKSQVFQHQHLRKQVSLSTKISKSGLFPHISVGKTEPVVIHYLIVQDSSRTLQNLTIFFTDENGRLYFENDRKRKGEIH